MKKQLVVALGLAVLATPAFATKARLEAFGEDNFGSYYINDNRNYFLNPAYINNHKDLVTYEFGRSGTGAASAQDSTQDPKAEGGFTKGHGNFVYGLHFGNSTPSAGIVRSLVGNNNLQERNPWDFFIGGDAGMKWGANVTYEAFDGGANAANRVASNAIRTRLGIIAGDVDAFAHISLKGDAKDFQGNEIEGKASYFVGASTLLNNYRLFVDYKHIAGDYTSTLTTGGQSESWKFNEIRLGAGRVEKLNDRANLFAKVSIERRMVEDDGAATLQAAGAGELTRYILPLNVGLEYDATSWLQLRASVSQYVWSTQEVDPKDRKSVV